MPTVPNVVHLILLVPVVGVQIHAPLTILQLIPHTHLHLRVAVIPHTRRQPELPAVARLVRTTWVHIVCLTPTVPNVLLSERLA